MDTRMKGSPGYQTWRVSVPYTDEQIAAELEKEADRFDAEQNVFMARRRRDQARQVLRGWLSSKVLRVVLDALIRECAICGNRALYRVGLEGRCRTHQRISTAVKAESLARIEARSDYYEAKDEVLADRATNLKRINSNKAAFVVAMKTRRRA